MRIVTGKIFDGILVSQILKLGWEDSSFSRIIYSWGMNDGAKWQFCSKTHFPYTIAFLIAFDAIYPWPWPSDKLDRLSLNPSFSARFVISIRGSAPGLKIKIRGVWQVESSKACCRLNGGGSINSWPISLLIRACRDWENLSGRIILMMINFLNKDTSFH